MRYGLAIPDSVDVSGLIELAREAETAGWDGVFYWDSFGVDPWVALTAVALSTERVRLGTMVTPLPRRSPWKVASEAATLDRVSSGRFILPVGLGVVEFERFGLTRDYKVRARMLDEGLAVMAGLWSGQPFHYDGAFYRVEETTGPLPAQTPRVPIWVVGGEKGTQLRRAARWDGALIQAPPDEIAQRRSVIEQLRAELGVATPLDIITEEETPGDDLEQAANIVRPYAEAGVTWWMEAVWNTPREQGGFEGMRRRIRQGPPPSV